MAGAQIIDYRDPRLGMPVLPAAAQDKPTQIAVRLLSELIFGGGPAVLAAPSVGLPVRVIGVRMDEVVHCLLNPKIVGGGPWFLSQGEMTPHTGTVRRDVMRLRSITIEGQAPIGTPVQLNIGHDLAIAVQQAIDMLETPLPFSWMTGFHHHWMRLRNEPVAARYDMVSASLYRHPGDPNLVFSGPNRRSLVRNDERICEIDALNPMQPCRPRDRLILALMLQMTGMRSVFLTQPEQFGLALGLTLMVPTLVAHVGKCDWPMDAANHMGIGASMRLHPVGLKDFVAKSRVDATIDAVVLDAIDAPDSSCLSQEVVCHIARWVSGQAGAFIVLQPHENPEVEAVLQRNFAAVYMYRAADGVVYLARKTAADPNEMRARLCDIARKVMAPWLLEQGVDQGIHLRKDGKREAI